MGRTPHPFRQLSRGALFACLACASPGNTGATTLVVSPQPGSAYSTIQSAINAAVPVQDDVSVLCGVYPEDVSMRDGVSVRGISPRCTTIVGLYGSPNPAVLFPPLATTTELSGFTIRGGSSRPGVSGGSGPAVITRNVVEGNGHGILIGGTGVARSVISRNVVRNNLADGIHVEMGEPPSFVTITRNLIVGSDTGVDVIAYPGSVTVANNTIARNREGGLAVYAWNAETITVANNVVASNGWSGGGGGIAVFSGPQSPQVEKNDAWSNAPFDFYVDPGGLPASNFSIDPRFVNELADVTGFEPKSGSPLVDVASSVWAPPVDLRGVPWDAGHGYFPLPDIGARENEGITGFRFGGPWRTYMSWDAIPPGPMGLTEYQLLRGDLGVLRSTGTYRQNPSAVPQAATWCELYTNFSDEEVPEAGQGFFYLVTGWAGCETPLGFTSAAALRPGYVCWGSCGIGSGGP